MKKIRILSVLLVVSLIAFLVGCGGGGGSSAPVDKDVTGISSALNGYMSAMRANDPAAAAKFLSSTAASPSGSVHTLMLQDFGIDINNHDDNLSWTFYVYPEDILQPSDEIAFVTARHTLHSGETITIKFSMVKEGGVWVIENMEIVSAASTGTTSSSFVTANFFPITSGAEHFYTMENFETDTLREEIIRYSFDDSHMVTVDGVNYYQMLDNIVDMSATTVSRRAMRGARKSIRRSSVRRNSVDDYYDEELYFGYSNGNLYMYIPDDDPTQDYVELFMKASYSYNSVETFQRRYYDGETEIVATVTLNIGSPQPFATPLKTYQAVKVTETIEWKNPSTGASESEEFSIYFAENVGVVGEDGWWDFNGTDYFINSRLIVRNVGANKETNNPYVSEPTNTDLGTFTIGDSVNIAFTAQGGDVSSRVFVTPSSIPEGLTFNTSTGVLSGTLSGTPAGDMDYSIDVKVRDKYDRYTLTYYNMTVKQASVVGGAAVTFLPVLSSVSEGQALVGYVMVNGTSVLYSEYSAAAFDVSPSSAASYVSFYDDGGYLKVSIYGYTPNDGTIMFWARVTRRSDSTVYDSALQTVNILPGT